MLETIQRTGEGLSLVDPFVESTTIAAKFPSIISAYCDLPTTVDQNDMAALLMKRRRALEGVELTEGLTQAETFILTTDKAVDNAPTPQEKINIYKVSLNQVDLLGLDDIDQRLIRMWFFDGISKQFYNYNDIEGEYTSNLRLIQAVIAGIFSDLELGARETTISRGRHALASASKSFDLFGENGKLLGEVLIGRKERLPDNYWDEEKTQRLISIITK